MPSPQQNAPPLPNDSPRPQSSGHPQGQHPKRVWWSEAPPTLPHQEAHLRQDDQQENPEPDRQKEEGCHEDMDQHGRQQHSSGQLQKRACLPTRPKHLHHPMGSDSTPSPQRRLVCRTPDRGSCAHVHNVLHARRKRNHLDPKRHRRRMQVETHMR